MKPPYRTIDELIGLIEEPQRSAVRRITDEHRQRFEHAQGSQTKHHAWQGGYLDHVTEAMNLAIVLHGALDPLRPLPFTLSDALVVLFLHDIEKPWKYEVADGSLRVRPDLQEKPNQRAHRQGVLAAYGFQPTAEQEVALRYAEGEGKDYHPTERMQNELAVFCNACDSLSARLWYNQPSADDPWAGSRPAR